MLPFILIPLGVLAYSALLSYVIRTAPIEEDHYFINANGELETRTIILNYKNNLYA